MTIEYIDNSLFFEGIKLEDLAIRYKTPLFVYSIDKIKENLLKYKNALDGVNHIICFAMKTNSNSLVLKNIASFGAGFDTVSGGEIYKVLNIGAATVEKLFFLELEKPRKK